MSGPKFMLGVDCSETEGEPRDDVMTGYGEARPFIGEPKEDIGEGKGLEVLMTDGWPTMPPMEGGWVWTVPIGPVESGRREGECVKKGQVETSLVVLQDI